MLKPKNYKRSRHAPLFAYRSEPRNLGVDGGLGVKRVIGPSIGWTNNHFLDFAPNWNDIANDIDPKIANQIRKDIQAHEKEKTDKKAAKKAPSIKDVRHRMSDMIIAHEIAFAATQAENTKYPILHAGEYEKSAADSVPPGQCPTPALSQYTKQMRLVHSQIAPSRVSKR
jgi:hypothetical protein